MRKLKFGSFRHHMQNFRLKIKWTRVEREFIIILLNPNLFTNLKTSSVDLIFLRIGLNEPNFSFFTLS